MRSAILSLALLTACDGLSRIDDVPVDSDPAAVESDTPDDTPRESGRPGDTSDCGFAEIVDCHGACVSVTLRGDGFCDDGTLPGRGGADLACARHAWDDGDCAPPGPVCGDGQLHISEQCDDNNTDDFDGCSSGCLLEVCGDGVRQPWEGCDDGNTDDDDGCDGDCEVCVDDALEDNDSRTSPTALAAPTGWPDLRACPSDDDWFTLPVAAGDRLVASAAFDADEGDVDLSIVDATGRVVASATGPGDAEVVRYTPAAAGTWAVRAWLDGDQGVVRGNDLALTLDVLTCDVDAHEDDDTPGTAWVPPALPVGAGLRACLSDPDLTRLDLERGDRVSATVVFDPAEGDLSLGLTDLAGAVLATPTATPGRQELRWTSTSAVAALARVTLGDDLGVEAGAAYDLVLDVQRCVDDAREPDDSPQGLAPETLPWIGAGLVACPLDDDHAAVTLGVGGQLQGRVTWDPADGDLRAELLGPTGAVVATAAGAPGDHRFSYTATAAGVHHLRTALLSEADATPGAAYEAVLAVSQCQPDPYEDNDARPAGAPLVAPLFAPDLGVCTGDEDFFLVDLAVGDRLSVALDFVDAEGDIDLQILDPAGATVASGRTQTDDERAAWSALTAGTYAVRVWLYADAGATPGNTYDLDVAVAPCAVDAHEEDDLPFLGAWAGDVDASWNVCMGDPDHVDATLQTGDQLDVAMTYDEAEGDLVLEILGPTGAVEASDSFGTGERSLTYQAEAPGPHSVRVRQTADADPLAGMPYEITVDLSVCRVDALEDDDDNAQATVVTPTFTATGLSACEHDDDVFAIPAVAGERIWVQARFRDADGDLDLELRNPSGTLVRSATSSDDDEELAYDVTTPGTYHLTAFNDADAGPAGVDYDLDVRVTSCAPDPLEDDDNRIEATPAPPVAAWDALTACANDEDWFTVDVAAGDWIEADMAHDRAEGDVDLRLRNTLGSTVAYGSTTAAGERIDHVTTQTGTYELIVELDTDAGATAGCPYDLDLLVLSCPDDALEDDDDVTQATDATPGLSAPDLVLCDDDDDWFAVTLAPGQTVRVDAYFTDAEGDLDLSLKDAGLTTVRSATSTTDDEQLTFTSAGGGTFFLRVYLASDGGDVPGTPYELLVQVL